MGSGASKPPNEYEYNDEVEDDQPEAPPHGRSDYDRDYSQNRVDQEEMKQDRRNPTQQRRAPARQEEYQENQEEEEEEEEVEEVRPLPNQKQGPRQGMEQPSRRTGNHPANNNQGIREPSTVAPKNGQGESTRLRSDGSPKVPRGRAQNMNTGKGGYRNAQQTGQNKNPQGIPSKGPVRGTRNEGPGNKH